MSGPGPSLDLVVTMKLLKGFVDAAARRLGYVPVSEIRDKLDYSFSVAKRLDEHREVVEQILARTTLFHDCPWHALHMAAQDDYLMRHFHMVHGCWPEEVEHGYTPADAAKMKDARLPPSKLPRRILPEVRKRPEILGLCCLPEYHSDGKASSPDWADVSYMARGTKGV